MIHAFEFLLIVDGPFWKVCVIFMKCSLAVGRISLDMDFFTFMDSYMFIKISPARMMLLPSFFFCCPVFPTTMNTDSLDILAKTKFFLSYIAIFEYVIVWKEKVSI